MTVKSKPLITTNPLYEAWKAKGFIRGKWGGWERPGRTIDMMEMCADHHSRQMLVGVYSWAIPSPEAIQFVAKRIDKIVEVGAGRGYWAGLFAQAGIDVVAYEPTVQGFDVVGNKWHSMDIQVGLYYDLKKGWSSAAKKHPDRTLFLCWPPYQNKMASTALQSYQGGQLLYVGEGEHGCCGDDRFWDEINKNWIEMESCNIPQWPHIKDYMVIYQHKERLAPRKRTRKITLKG